VSTGIGAAPPQTDHTGQPSPHLVDALIGEPPPRQLPTADPSQRERSKLRRELGRLDTVCLLIAAIVVLDTLGAVARGGAQTLTWLVLVGALYFVPAGLVVAELGSAFPQQGGAYAWARLAFGRVAGSLVALVYWVEAAVWLGGSLAITAVAVTSTMLVALEGAWRVLFALGFVWTAVSLTAVPLRAGKRVPLAGAAAQILLLGFFTATVAVYAARYGVRGLAARDLLPSWAVFTLVGPVLVYSFLGFELPSTAAGEMRDPERDVPASIVRAGALTCAMYCVPVLAIVLVVPADQITGLTGFIDAIAGVFVVYGRASGVMEALAAGLFVWVLLCNGVTWTMGSSRAQAAASLDGAGPSTLGLVTARTGTPVPATIIGGIMATVTALAAFAVAGDDNARYFSVVLTLSISLLALGSLAVFPALIRLRHSYPGVARPFRVPGASVGAWIASGLATAWSALALAAALWPGLATTQPDAYLPEGFAGDRLGFVVAELVPLTAVVAVGALFARLGHRGERSRANSPTEPDDLEAPTGHERQRHPAPPARERVRR
jgi:amino acid transporter